MTETEFRVKHSELIEYYQLIEMRFKSACAGLLADEEKGWFNRLDDYESDPFGKLIQKFKEIQRQKQLSILSQTDFVKLDELREKRNYWVHQCFGGQEPIVFRNGNVRETKYVIKITQDFDDAVEWDKKITEVVRASVKNYS